MKKLTDTITFRHGATINNRIVQTPMLTNSGLDEKSPKTQSTTTTPARNQLGW